VSSTGTVKVGPALITGNTIVAKPAPTTPLTSLLFAEMVADMLPPGVLNIIVDNNDLGALMTKHKDIAKVSFTGSTATGKKVMESVSSSLKRLTLELGGNDAAIVLDDVDVKAVAPKIFDAAMSNAGQICLATKRVYAHSSVYEQLCTELARRFPGIEVRQRALADYEGQSSFVRVLDPDLKAYSGLQEQPYPKSVATETITVEVECLDNHLPDGWFPDFMKVDIEGAELLAFQGMGVLLRTIRAAHIEVSFRELYADQPLIDEVRNYLESFGLRMWVLLYDVSGYFGDAIFIRDGCDLGVSDAML